MADSDRGHTLHREAQRRAWLALTARERLAWLEEAKRFAARALGTARSRTGLRARPKPKDSRD